MRPSQALLIGHPSVGIPSTGLLSSAVGHFVLRFVIAKNTEIGNSLHGAYVARQCPVRLFRERDPFETAEPAPPDDALQTLFDEGHAFETEIVNRLAQLHGADLVQIPGRDDESGEHRAALTAAALRDGVQFIAGALLEPDAPGRRLIGQLCDTGSVPSVKWLTNDEAQTPSMLCKKRTKKVAI